MAAHLAPRVHRATPAVALVALLLALTSCTSGDGERRSLEDVVRDAVEQAQRDRADGSGETGADDGAESPLGTDGRTTFDDVEYRSTLSGTIALLERFWAQELPTLGGEYSAPSGYTYYRSDQEAGPECGGQQAPARNAFYCPAGDFIAWDETGLMIPYYVGGGDFAAAFVLAHEFGHAMQVRLPQQERVGVLRELQADCLAGAWAGWTADQGYLEEGDLDEATLAVFAARDVPGTEWTDPQAHGSGFERTRAFGDGFEAGAVACYPAPAQEWVVERS